MAVSIILDLLASQNPAELAAKYHSHLDLQTLDQSHSILAPST